MEDRDVWRGMGAEQLVLDERAKQRAKWSAAHDDQYEDGELARIASAFARPATADPLSLPIWAVELFEDHTNRERLVIAAAFLIAEIERLDRKAMRSKDRE